MQKSRRVIIRSKVSSAVVQHPHPEAIRHQHINAYKTQLSSLKNANEKMRRYVEIDQPAFTLWWQQEFSDLLSAQMNLEKTFMDLQLLIDAVDQYRQHYGCSYQRAYNVVSKAQLEGTLAALMRNIFEEKDRTRQKAAKTAASLPLDDGFQAWFEQAKDQETKHSQSAPPIQEIPSQTPEETTDNYIKKIYRDLVRHLHPDAKDGGEQSTEEKLLWLELQNAYEWRDLDRLEGIFRALHGQMSAAIDFARIPIGDIFAMKEAVAKKLNLLRRELKEAKKEANWDFENRRKKRSFLHHLAKSIEHELGSQTMLLEYRIEKLQKKVHSWSSARKNQKQKSSRREASSDHWA